MFQSVVVIIRMIGGAARGSTLLLLSVALLCLSTAVQAERYTVPWFEPPSAGGDPQGVLRIVNAAADAGTVTIHAIDDDGALAGTAVLALNGSAAVEISATELQTGDAARGLSSGVGNLSGGVRLALESDVPIVPLALLRAADGTLSAVHDTVLQSAAPGAAGYRYDVAVFHPASHATQPSRLRLINPNDTAAQVAIDARDDAGAAASGGTVQLTLPPGGARTLTSQQLEAGDAAAFSGRLGAGVGNWRLSVSADRPIQVVNVAVGAVTGYWSNLSTTAVAGWAPQDAAAFEARFLGRTTVSRDGQNRTTFQVLPDNGFLHGYMDDGVEIRQQGRYSYERTGRDAGILRLDYDAGVSCEARFFFGSRISGWYAFVCVDREDRVEVWTGNTWLSLDDGAMPLDLGPGPDDRVYTAGTAIDTLTLPAASGGDGEFTYSLSPEVPGLSFDPATRELTGTPSETGVWLMTYRVRDASGDTDWRYFYIAVQAAGGATTTFGVGDTLSDLPTGSWTPDVTSNGTFLLSGGIATVNLDRGGYIEEGDYRYTCQSSVGCMIENRRVTSGTVLQTTSGTAPGEVRVTGNFELQPRHQNSRGFAYANDRFYILNWLGNMVYAYTGTGERDPDNDFDVPAVSLFDRFAYANGRFYIFNLRGEGGKLFAYTDIGQRDASNDLLLHDADVWPQGIAYADGRLYVVSSRGARVYAYTASGDRDPTADFDLDDDNRRPRGIAHANGRFYVVDEFPGKVYAYTSSGARDATADFALACENGSAVGIAYAYGAFHVLDWIDRKIYSYTAGNADLSPCFSAGSGPGNQTFTVDTAIDTLTLPEASGGNGPLTYSLSPPVPGLIFNASANVRELSGTPSSAGTYDMTFRVRDIDGDADSLTFTITVEDPGGGGQTTTYGVGDTLSDLPTGSWTPDVTSGGSFSSSGGNVTIRLNNGGYIEEGDYRYTCQSAGGCLVENRRVSSGTVARTSAGTEPGGGEDADDHGDDRASATRVDVGSDTQGNLSAGDVDYFRVDVDESGTLEIYTSGGVDTVGQLEDSTGSPVDDNDDGGSGTNFRIATDVTAGTYYVRVRGFGSQTAGDYTLHVRFSDSSSTGTGPDDYTPLEGLRVSAGRVQFGFFSAGGCIRLSNTTINGVTYTVHSSKWQRRDSASSAWEDVSGTEQQGGLCAYNPTAAGEYRLVGEVSINGVRGRYSSENTITVR